MSQPRTEEAVRGHFSYVVLNNTTKKRLGLFLPHQTSQDIHQKLPRSPILNPPKNIDRPSVLILKNSVEMKNNRSWCSVGLSNAYKLFIFLSNCRVVRSMATRLFFRVVGRVQDQTVYDDVSRRWNGQANPKRFRSRWKLRPMGKWHSKCPSNWHHFASSRRSISLLFSYRLWAFRDVYRMDDKNI